MYTQTHTYIVCISVYPLYLSPLIHLSILYLSLCLYFYLPIYANRQNVCSFSLVSLYRLLPLLFLYPLFSHSLSLASPLFYLFSLFLFLSFERYCHAISLLFLFPWLSKGHESMRRARESIFWKFIFQESDTDVMGNIVGFQYFSFALSFVFGLSRVAVLFFCLSFVSLSLFLYYCLVFLFFVIFSTFTIFNGCNEIWYDLNYHRCDRYYSYYYHYRIPIDEVSNSRPLGNYHRSIPITINVFFIVIKLFSIITTTAIDTRGANIPNHHKCISIRYSPLSWFTYNDLNTSYLFAHAEKFITHCYWRTVSPWITQRGQRSKGQPDGSQRSR